MEIYHVEESNSSVVLGGSKSRAFSVASTAEFINVLSDSLYSNKLLAVVREVMCNAWDAHIMGGKTDTPIKVKITKDAIIITDQGPGIHDDLIGSIYCSYGESTKRGDSASTGGFGLGCKAPFAISDTFTVTSAHQGQKTVYALTKSTELTDGLPELRNVVTTPCGDETGITVTIPLNQDWNADTALAYARTVAFWGEMKANIGSVDVPYDEQEMNWASNGEKLGLKNAPYGFILSSKCPYYGGIKPHRNVPRIHVQYGTVIYPVEPHAEYEEIYKQIEKILTSNPKYSFWASHDNVFLLMRAEPDSLTVAPSREMLTYSKYGVATLKTMLTNALDKLNQVSPVLQQRVLDHVWKESFAACIQKFNNKIHDLSEMIFIIKSVLNYNYAQSRNNESLQDFLVTPDEMHLYYLSSRYKNTWARYNSMVRKNLIAYIASYKNSRWNKIAKQVIRGLESNYTHRTPRNEYDPYNQYRKYIIRAIVDKYGPEMVHKYYRVVKKYNLEPVSPDRVSYYSMFDPFRILLANNKQSIRNFLENDEEFKYNWTTADSHQIMVLPKTQKKYDIEEVADHLTSMGFRVERIYADEGLQPVRQVRTASTNAAPKRKGYALLRDVVVKDKPGIVHLDYKNKFHSAKSVEEPEVMVHTAQLNQRIVVADFDNPTKLGILLKYFPDTVLVASSQTVSAWVKRTGMKTGREAMSELMNKKAGEQDFLNMIAYNYAIDNKPLYKYFCRIPEISKKFGLILPYDYSEIRTASSLVEHFRYSVSDNAAYANINNARINTTSSGSKIITDLPGYDNIKDNMKYLSFIRENSGIWKFLIKPPEDGNTCPYTGLEKTDRPRILKMLLQALS